MSIFINQRILLISSEPWNHNFLSKHHYAITLAQRGNKVFFLNPPTSCNQAATSDFLNLVLIDYKPVIRGLNYLPKFLRERFLKKIIKRIEKLANGKFDVVWSFDPYRFQDLTLFKSKVALYYAADIHKSSRNEVMVADSAQIVLAPSRQILEHINTSTIKQLVSHAVTDNFFLPSSRTLLPGNNKIKIGYVGNLHSCYLNFDLLEATIRSNSHCDFIFIGDNSGITMKSFNNTHFIGSRDNSQLPSFLNSCHILLLCYDTDRFWSAASNSHKVMEYLTTGNVIVSTRLAAYVDIPGLLEMPTDNQQLPNLLHKVSQQLDFYNRKDFCEKRKSFAQQHTYEKELSFIEKIIVENVKSQGR